MSFPNKCTVAGSTGGLQIIYSKHVTDSHFIASISRSPSRTSVSRHATTSARNIQQKVKSVTLGTLPRSATGAPPISGPHTRLPRNKKYNHQIVIMGRPKSPPAAGLKQLSPPNQNVPTTSFITRNGPERAI